MKNQEIIQPPAAIRRSWPSKPWNLFKTCCINLSPVQTSELNIYWGPNKNVEMNLADIETPQRLEPWRKWWHRVTRRMAPGLAMSSNTAICSWSAWTGSANFCHMCSKEALSMSYKSQPFGQLDCPPRYCPSFVAACIPFLCSSILLLRCCSIKASLHLLYLSLFPSALQPRCSREVDSLQLIFQLPPASTRSLSISATDQTLYHTLV